MVANINVALGRCRLIRIASPRYIVNVAGNTIAECDDDLSLVSCLKDLSANQLVQCRILFVESVRAVCPCYDDFGRGRVAVPVV